MYYTYDRPHKFNNNILISNVFVHLHNEKNMDKQVRESIDSITLTTLVVL